MKFKRFRGLIFLPAVLFCLLLGRGGAIAADSKQMDAPTPAEMKTAERLIAEIEKIYYAGLPAVPIPEKDVQVLYRLATAWCKINKGKAIETIKNIQRYAKNADYDVFSRLLQIGDVGGIEVMDFILKDYPEPDWLKITEPLPAVESAFQIAAHGKSLSWRQMERVLERVYDELVRQQIETLWAQGAILHDPGRAAGFIADNVEDEEQRGLLCLNLTTQLAGQEGYIPAIISLQPLLVEFEEYVGRPGEFTNAVTQNIIKNLELYGTRVPQGQVDSLVAFAQKLDSTYARTAILEAVADDCCWKDKKRAVEVLRLALEKAPPRDAARLLVKIAHVSPESIVKVINECKGIRINGPPLWEEIRRSAAATPETAMALFEATITRGKIEYLKNSRLLAYASQCKPVETFARLADSLTSASESRRKTAFQCVMFGSQSTDKEAAKKLLTTIESTEKLMSDVFGKPPYRTFLVAAWNFIDPAEGKKRMLALLQDIKAGRSEGVPEDGVYLLMCDPSTAVDIIPSLGKDAAETVLLRAPDIARYAAFAPEKQASDELKKIASGLGWLANKATIKQRDELLKSSLTTVIRTWMTVDAAAAVGFAKVLPQTDLRTPMIIDVIPMLAEIKDQDLSKACELIIAHTMTDKDTRDQIFTMLLNALVDKHPDQAAAVLDSAQDPTKYIPFIRQLVAKWSERFYIDQVGLLKKCKKIVESTHPAEGPDVGVLASMATILTRIEPAEAEVTVRELHRYLSNAKSLDRALLIPIARYDVSLIFDLCAKRKMKDEERVPIYLDLAEYMLKDKPSMERKDD
jgi:hypothetical protein